MQTTDLGSNRLKLLAAQNENRIKRDMLNQAFGTIAAYDPSFEVAKYKGMMQPTANLPIPGIPIGALIFDIDGLVKSVVEFVQKYKHAPPPAPIVLPKVSTEPKHGRKFRTS